MMSQVMRPFWYMYHVLRRNVVKPWWNRSES